jgi:hypothetical protein
MAILTRESDARDKLQAHEPAVLAYRRGPLVESAGEPYRAPRSIAEVGGLDDVPLPAVVLQLPDLKTRSYLRRDWGISLASQAYWVALVSGALLALWLVLSARKPAEQPADEAPAWTGQAPADRAISTWGANTGDPSAAPPKWRATDAAATSDAMPAHSHDSPAMPAESTQEAVDMAAPVLPSPDATPQTGDAAGVPFQSSEAIRTARGGETRWDGNTDPIQPSEAAPLGITVPVPQ